MLTESRSAGSAAQRLQRVRQRQPVDGAAERAGLDRRQEGAGRQHLPVGHASAGPASRRRPASPRVPRLHDRLEVEDDAALGQRLGDAEAQPAPSPRAGSRHAPTPPADRGFEELEGVDRGELVHWGQAFGLAAGRALPNATFFKCS